MSTEPRIQVLDGIRGLALLLVFLTHAIALPLEPATGLDIGPFLLTRLGWSGVDLFFVLSGFLITGILLDTKGRDGWLRAFFTRRALRIFPLYYGVLVLLFLILPRLISWSDPQWAVLQSQQTWFWTYTVNLIGLTGQPGPPLNTSHFWSLCIEEQFYVVWPFVVWRLRPTNLVKVMAGTVALGLVFRWWLVTQSGFPATLAYVVTPGRLDGLMVGAFLAVQARQGGLAMLRPWAYRAGIGCTVVLAAVFAARREITYHDAVVAMVGYPLIAVAYGSLLVLTLTADSGTRLSRLFSSKALTFCGKYSYGLYVFHYPLLGAIGYKMAITATNLGPLGVSKLPMVLAQAAIVAVVSIALAVVSFRWFESPFLRAKARFNP